MESYIVLLYYEGQIIHPNFLVIVEKGRSTVKVCAHCRVLLPTDCFTLLAVVASEIARKRPNSTQCTCSMPLDAPAHVDFPCNLLKALFRFMRHPVPLSPVPILSSCREALIQAQSQHAIPFSTRLAFVNIPLMLRVSFSVKIKISGKHPGLLG